MNTEILKVLKDLRSDLFYQIESKFGAEKASKYPSIVDADSLINKLTICGVSNCNCDNGNDFFEEQYILKHLINDTWQVVGEKTNTVWKQGTKEVCQEWLDL